MAAKTDESESLLQRSRTTDRARRRSSPCKNGDNNDKNNGNANKSEPWWCWLTLACSICINLLAVVHFFSFGMFYDRFMEKFNTSSGVGGIVPSTIFLTLSLGAYLAGPFVTYFDCRTVGIVSSFLFAFGVIVSAMTSSYTVFLVFFGAVSGLGSGGLAQTYMASVQHCFDTNRNMATAILCVGFTTGEMVTPVILEYLLRTYGFSGTVLITGGIILNAVPLSAAMRCPVRFSQYFSARLNDKQRAMQDSQLSLAKKNCALASDEDSEARLPTSVDEHNGEKEAASLRESMKANFLKLCGISLLKNKDLVYVTLYKFHSRFGRYAIMSHMVSAALDKDISEIAAAGLMSIAGALNLVLRTVLIVTLPFERIISPYGYMTISSVCFFGSSACLSLASSYQSFVAAAVFFGIGEATTAAPCHLALNLAVGPEDYAVAYALFEIGILPSSFLGPTVTGFMRDATGTYFAPFVLMASFSSIGLVFNTLMHISARQKKKSEQSDQS